MRSILLFPLAAMGRCVYMTHVCLYTSDCVGVCGNVCWVADVVKDSSF